MKYIGMESALKNMFIEKSRREKFYSKVVNEHEGKKM